ncbi:A disintegrin and metalloproteinase with thrombospondin motifs 7-like [Amphibalanus amphitrite]|uniref:A disintegrin and metalloproteinase with thrombospondin motifs 7-like n=1 Tax=Amphibalanus amphitrite TaxID=1232801 RepID=UPI001C91251D|nr:A disintegrin and metalloproteinase with thrombospondin motifs 7-like [Amphibalanus amphitrite]
MGPLVVIVVQCWCLFGGAISQAIDVYESLLERVGGRGQLPLLVHHFLAQVAAVFRHPSLGLTVTLSFPEVELWRERPPAARGAANSTLDRFCELHAGVQQRAGHRWDVGMLLVGGPLGVPQRSALGVARLGTVCGEVADGAHSGCAAVQFGAVAGREDALPTHGLGLAALTAAHELGHTLGLYHDGDGDDCPDSGFVMASGLDSRRPGVQWSACSAAAARRLWPGCLREAGAPPPPPPPSLPSLDGQCQLQLGDPLATSGTDPDPCRRLTCQTAAVRAIRDSLLDAADLERYSDLLSPGPALEGSVCGSRSVCRAGRCAPCVGPCAAQEGSWSGWEPLGGCLSPCYPGSLGVQTFTRRCVGADPSRAAHCAAGPTVRRVLCAPRCPRLRHWVWDARRVCRRSDPAAEPLRVRHDAARPAAACAVRCRKDADGGQLFWWPTEVFFGTDASGDGPFLPDGTLCHRDDGVNFYCVEHRCTPQTEALYL